MIKTFDMDSCQPIGDEQTAYHVITEPVDQPLAAPRLMTVDEASRLEPDRARFSDPVVMLDINDIFEG